MSHKYSYHKIPPVTSVTMHYRSHETTCSYLSQEDHNLYPSHENHIVYLSHEDQPLSSVVDPEWFFFGSRSYFSAGSYMNFSNILNISFTFVFQSCKCVRLHIMTRNKYFREILYYFKFISDQELTDPEWFFPRCGSCLRFLIDRIWIHNTASTYNKTDHNLYMLS
jgi:hypothetical protein